MTTLANKAILSGADNRLPMLEKDMYDSWKSRMELYMLNRQNGQMILESVESGPLIWPSFEENGVTRPKKYSKLSAREALQADCDIKETNIILQGVPPEVYALVSNHKVAKELWERIQLLMQGTSLTKQERECKLYDEFDKFAYKKGESLREFYLRFSLLLNDMNIYNMKLEQFQVNTKFLNTLPPEWSKFVTDVKLVRDLHTTNIERFKLIGLIVPVFQKGDDHIDVINHMMSFLTAVGRQTFVAAGTSRTYTSGASGNNSGKQRTVICYNCKGEGHMSKQCTKPKRKRDDSWFKDKVLLVQAQASGQILHEEELAFLAGSRNSKGRHTDCLRSHNAAYQPDDLDAYDSDCDELNTAKVALMTNLSHYVELGNNYDSNIIPYSQYWIESHMVVVQNSNSFAQQDDLILSVIEQLKTQVVHCTKTNLENKSVNDTLTAELERYKEQVKVLKEGQNVDLKSIFYDNTTKKALGFQNHFYLKKAQHWNLCYMLVINQKTNPIVIPDSEETLTLAEESRSKMLLKHKDNMMQEKIKQIDTTPIDYVALNKLYKDFETQFVPQTELSAEQAFWSHNSVSSSEPDLSDRPTNVEVPKELPKVSMVNTSLKKLKYHLANFDVVVKERTTPTAITEGTWGFEHTKACFRDEIIPFVKALKDLFSTFNQQLVDELAEVQNVFYQMEQAVEQHRVESKTFEVKMNQALNENERLLEQVMSKDIVNLMEKVLVITTLKDELRKLKVKDLANNEVTHHPSDLEINTEPITPKLLNKRSAHSAYIKHTQEEAAVLRDLVDHIQANYPLDPTLESTYHVVAPKGTDHVQHSKLNDNSELKYVKCNGCMLSDNHDLCVLDYINNVNARAKSKSAKKQTKRKVWKPTGKMFTTIGYIWRPTGRTFTIVGNACPLTRITTTTEAPLRKPVVLDNETSKPVITQSPRGISIKQSKYALESLKKYGYDSYDPVDTPMVEKSKLDEDKEGKAVDPSHNRGYDRHPHFKLTSNADHAGLSRYTP
ncbi:retrovirus-related pol polyprotein from transposon TNT 1-94 [Tanacetum coccineum]